MDPVEFVTLSAFAPNVFTEQFLSLFGAVRAPVFFAHDGSVLSSDWIFFCPDPFVANVATASVSVRIERAFFISKISGPKICKSSFGNIVVLVRGQLTGIFSC